MFLVWGSMIILVSSAITMVTTLSTSAICTNGVVSGGGIYFLVSKTPSLSQNILYSFGGVSFFKNIQDE
jgi:hypothetical protein